MTETTSGRGEKKTAFMLRQVRSRVWDSPASILFLMVLLTYSYFYTGGGHNEAARIDAIRAWVEEGRFIVDTFASNSADLIQINGHVYSSKAPGTTLAGIPFFWFFENLLGIFPMTENVKYHWVSYLTSIFTISLGSALLSLLLYWFSIRLGFSVKKALFASASICLGTIYFPFSTMFFGHSPTAFLAFLAFYQLFAYKVSIEKEGLNASEPWRLALSGFALGYAMTTEYPAVIASGLLLVYAMICLISGWKVGLIRGLSTLFGGLVLGLLPLFIYNFLAFGTLWYIPYEAYADDPGATFEAHRKGMLGIRMPLLDPEFGPIFLRNLLEITFNPLRGLFVANPFLILIFPGFTLLMRRKVRASLGLKPLESLLSFGIFFAYLLFNAAYGDSIVYWGGGASFGPRHLIVALPFLVVPLLTALSRRYGRYLSVPLVLISVFFCLMATAIEPRTPYSPPNPILDYYLPRFLAGELALTESGIFSDEPMYGKTAAFNWGGLLGLTGLWQLLPLLFIWVLGVVRIHGLVHQRGHGPPSDGIGSRCLVRSLDRIRVLLRASRP